MSSLLYLKCRRALCLLGPVFDCLIRIRIRQDDLKLLLQEPNMYKQGHREKNFKSFRLPGQLQLKKIERPVLSAGTVHGGEEEEGE